MIRTLVVEDDPQLADAHAEFVRRVPGFVVTGVVHRGGEALRFIGRQPVELVLLDFFLPDMNGLDVCRGLRAHGLAIDVIAVTSARDVDVVRAAVAHGVVQYLLKPFTFAMFREKLERYSEYRHELSRTGSTTAQHDVDRALAALRGTTGGPLPKGLSSDTLTAVIDHLRTGGALSAADLADAVGIARVTARRYLEVLVERDLARRTPRYGSPGRPGHLYEWNPRPEPVR